MKKTTSAAVLAAAMLTLVGCCGRYGTLLWSGACYNQQPTPESIEAARHEDRYQAYEKARERKVVRGLGGAMFHRDGY